VGYQPDCTAQPILGPQPPSCSSILPSPHPTLPQIATESSAEGGRNKSRGERHYRRAKKMANTKQKRKSCRKVEPGSFAQCVVTSATDTFHDLLNWKAVDFPKDKTTYLQRLLHVLTKNNRLVYLSALGALIVAVAWFFGFAR